MDYNSIFQKKLNDLQHEDIYRVFVNLERSPETFPLVYCPDFDFDVTIWCSNDYLGQGVNPLLIDTHQKALLKYGVGSGGTRNISGTSNALVSLENKIAHLYQKDKSLVFGSAFIANEYSISAIAEVLPDCIIISDKNNHASMILGAKKSGVQKEVFEHNDMHDLERILKKHPKNSHKLVIFESIYSMSGTVAPVEKIIELARRYNALTYIDEVHAVGLYGNQGLGVCEKLGVIHDIDIIHGSFAKGYGVIGGYVTAKQEITEVIRLTAQGFIFTTALPASTAETIEASIDYIADNMMITESFFAKVKLLKKKLESKNIKLLDNDSHIIVLMIGNSKLCNQIAYELLLDYHIYIAPINFPTVAQGKERLRIIVSYLHTEEMMDYLVESVEIIFKKYCII